MNLKFRKCIRKLLSRRVIGKVKSPEIHMGQTSSMLRIRKWAFIWKALGVVFLLTVIFVGRIAWELRTPEIFECHHSPQPFASRQSPEQAVFIGRIFATGLLWPLGAGPIREGTPRRYWAIAVVQKTYWGLPWWDRKLVLLTAFVRGGTGFERGDTYFIDGNRERRWLTRRLPIFEIHCTRTVALKYADIDLRVLNDGPPKNGGRIMGYTYRRTSSSEWKEMPSVKVGINGPTGEIVVTSDPQGFYDISGLPPGTYYVHGMDPQAGPYWALLKCHWSLRVGDVRECDVDAP
jgi:hypothetical protein